MDEFVYSPQAAIFAIQEAPQKMITKFQVAYKNLLRKKSPQPSDPDRHRPFGLGAREPARVSTRAMKPPSTRTSTTWVFS